MPAERAQYARHRAEPTGATGLRLLTVMMRPVYGFFVFGIIITSSSEGDGQVWRCRLEFDRCEENRLSFDSVGLLP